MATIETIDRYLDEWRFRSMVSITEATDALLDLRNIASEDMKDDDSDATDR